MIAVRIPKEIRSYKEKLVFGLNLRQLISTIVTIVICVPVYYFGTKYIHEEIISWVTLLIAAPCLAFGFFKFKGMVFEKLVVAVIKKEFLYPSKRYYKSENAFREWQDKATKEEKAKDKRSKRQKELDSTERIISMIKEQSPHREGQ